MSLLKPFIKLEEAQCHDCMHPIAVYEFDACTIQLSQEGFPVQTDVVTSKIMGVCPNCGRVYEVERNGIGFAITSDLRREFKGVYKGEQQTEIYEKQLYSSSNEFGYNEQVRR